MIISRDLEQEGSPPGSVDGVVLRVSRWNSKFSSALDSQVVLFVCLLSIPLLHVHAFGIWGRLRDIFIVYPLLRKMRAKFQRSEMYFYCCLWHED